MAKTRFLPDRGLTARMTLVMFLLGALFVALIVVLMYAGGSIFGGGIAFVIGLAGLGVAWFQWYNSDTVALKAMRAREVTPEEAPELHGVIDRLCALADMPKPRVAIAYTDMPNAFATGRSPEHSAVCVTTGILDRLTTEEIEGVLAHELSHVAHRDVLVMTLAASAGIAAGMLTRGSQYGMFFGGGRSPEHSAVCVTTGILDRLTTEEIEGVLAHELSHVAHRDVLVMTLAASAGIAAGMLTRGSQYGMFFGGGRRDNNNNGVPFWLIALVVSLVVYAVSFFLTRLLSRYRELCADRSGAYLTQKPSALASALTKISGDVASIPQKDLREVQSMNAFFITPAISGMGMKTLTSTHPSLEQRLEQLAKVAAELGKPMDGGFSPGVEH